MFECWNDNVNARVVEMCRRGDPMCSGEQMARLLELDYCDGYWEQQLREAGGAGKGYSLAALIAAASVGIGVGAAAALLLASSPSKQLPARQNS